LKAVAAKTVVWTFSRRRSSLVTERVIAATWPVAGSVRSSVRVGRLSISCAARRAQSGRYGA